MRPYGAYYHRGMNEFILPYEAVRQSSSPHEMVLDFLRSTYEAAAELAHWDRASLERNPPQPLPAELH